MAPPAGVAGELVLDRWRKEEQLIAGRVAKKAAEVAGSRREIALFLLVYLLLHTHAVCRLYAGAAGPCLPPWTYGLVFALLASLAYAFLIRCLMWEKGRYQRQLEVERGQLELLRLCVGELEKGGDAGFLVEYYAVRGLERRLDVGRKGWAWWRDLFALLLVAFACLVAGLNMRLCTVIYII